MRMFRNVQPGHPGRQVTRIEVSIADPARAGVILYDVKYYDLRDRYIGGVSNTMDPIRVINEEITCNDTGR